MHPDGVCKLPGGLYTKTVEYEDINYSVASTEDQTAIFSGWSSFLNYFDSSLPFQLSFINRRSHSRSRYQVNIPKADDNYNSVRDEFTGMLKNQIAKSNNGIERSKYITFGIPAEGIAEARPRLERVEADVMGNFKRLGVPSEPMDGRARLALLHSQMHPGSREAFRFSWKDIPQTGLGTKDFIAPDSLDFRQSRTFRIGQYWGAVSYLQIMASELSDKLLAEILELDAEMTVTMHIQTVDQLKAIKTIKGKISDIGKMKVEEQRKAVRSGYDPDILPPDLITFSKDAAELLADLQSRNERMFLLTFTVVNLAPTRQRLENDVFTVGGIAQKYNCALRRLDWQQEQGFVSSLALGYNEVEIQRGMTTSSTAIFIPFMTRELRMAGQALYYGMNALSHNVIMADRKKLKSANGMYLGSTGSGKSFAAKRELLNVFLTIPQDRIIVVDPMGEYAPLVRRLGGQVIEIAPDSPHHLNPMDVELNMAAGESPLSMKADFLLSLCELVVGGKEGLQPIEKTVIDRCVRLVYREQALGLETAKTPLLQDLYEELLRQPEPEARRVATALELYCTGSLNLFNHPTNVKTDSRVVCIVLKNMLKGILAMLEAMGMSSGGGTWTVFSVISDVPFYFLPFLLAVSAARKFKVNEYLGLCVAGALMYPTFVDAVGAAENPFSFLGITIPVFSYASSVFPVVLGVGLLAIVYHFVDRFIPDVLKMVVVPMVSLVVTIPVTYLVLAPLGNYGGLALANGIVWLFSALGPVAGFLLGFFMPLIVLCGMHQSTSPIQISNIATLGYDYLLPVSFCHNMAESGAAMGAALRMKDSKMRAAAMSTSFSAFLGISEPALFTVQVVNRTPLIAAMIGNGVGGALTVILGVKCFGFVMPGITSLPVYAGSDGTLTNLLLMIVCILVSWAVSCVVSFVLGGHIARKNKS